MFVVKNPQEFYQIIDTAIQNELSEVAEVFPDFAENLKSHVLWGIFSNDEIYKAPGVLFGMNYDVIELAKQQVKEQQSIADAQFFASSVEAQLQGKSFTVDVDYEDSEAFVKEPKKPLVINTQFNAVVSLTLPDYQVVFDKYMPNGHNPMLNNLIDIYGHWRFAAMNQLYNYYYQIGGHGRWIQYDYNNKYIAQINANIGDAGSVFVSVEDNKIIANVDMY